MKKKHNDGWPERSRYCMYCQKELSGSSFTVAISRRKMVIRKGKRGTRGMHEDCAKLWLEKNAATSKNVGTFPEIEKAQLELEQLFRDLRIIERKIWDREMTLESALWDHHRAAAARLKGEDYQKPDRSSICTGCKQSFQGFGYLSFARQDEIGRGKRFCFACLERYGELGLHQMEERERANEMIAKYLVEDAAKKAAKEVDSAPEDQRSLTRSTARLSIVVPFPKNGRNTTH